MIIVPLLTEQKKQQLYNCCIKNIQKYSYVIWMFNIILFEVESNKILRKFLFIYWNYINRIRVNTYIDILSSVYVNELEVRWRKVKKIVCVNID